MHVIGIAHEGSTARHLVRHGRPDVITLDIEMPGESGLEILKSLAADIRCPVIMVSGESRHAAEQTMLAMQLGAYDFILKYSPVSTINPYAVRRELIQKVQAAAQLGIQRAGWPNQQAPEAGQINFHPLHAAISSHPTAPADGLVSSRQPARLLLVGGSTGGPTALRELLAPLDRTFAVIAVQHISAGFLPALAIQLSRQTGWPVQLAKSGQTATPGVVLLAPDHQHLTFDAFHRIRLHPGEPVHGHCPSIDVALHSATAMHGYRFAAVLLSGMGADGVSGLIAAKRSGAATFAQSAETCVVFGITRRAIEADAALFCGSPRDIALALNVSQRQPALRAWDRQVPVAQPR